MAWGNEIGIGYKRLYLGMRGYWFRLSGSRWKKQPCMHTQNIELCFAKMSHGLNVNNYFFFFFVASISISKDYSLLQLLKYWNCLYYWLSQMMHFVGESVLFDRKVWSIIYFSKMNCSQVFSLLQWLYLRYRLVAMSLLHGNRKLNQQNISSSEKNVILLKDRKKFL